VPLAGGVARSGGGGIEVASVPIQAYCREEKCDDDRCGDHSQRGETIDQEADKHREQDDAQDADDYAKSIHCTLPDLALPFVLS
jgi:hypothetical protein